MRIMMHIFCPVLFTVFVLTGPCPALQIEWAPIAADSSYLLAPPNAYNDGGMLGVNSYTRMEQAAYR